jgi:hypothetical protein
MSKLALETEVVPPGPGKSSFSDHSQAKVLSPSPASELAVSALGPDATATVPYRLYKRRWLGVIAMVCTVFLFTPISADAKNYGQFALEVVGSASWPWFGPISNNGTVLSSRCFPNTFLTGL